MKLGVIDKDEYRQYRYWQAFQKLLLPCAAGFTVAAVLLGGDDLRRLAQVVSVLLWVLFVVTAVTGHLVARHMVRDLPASLQSLLLFSSDGEPEPAARVSNGENERLVSPPAAEI
jgi:hypothetical protein